MNRRKAFKFLRTLLLVLTGLAVVGLPSLIPLVKATVSFSFAAVGDFGGISSTGSCVANTLAGTCVYQVVSKMGSMTPSFALSLGDMGYHAQNPTEWCSAFKGMPGISSLALVTGNHDTSNSGSITYDDRSLGFASDSLTNEASDGFLDDSSNPSSTGYVSACSAPAGINWVGSSVSGNGLACTTTAISGLSHNSCYAREYYFDYPSYPNTIPIMRFIIIPAGICGAWFNAATGCPDPNTGKPPASYTGWNAPTSPATCNSPPAGSEHYCWLKNTIDEAKNRGLWTAVVNHKQCIDDDPNPCEATLAPLNLAASEMGGVDLWLDGHDHSYQRSVQLKGPCTGSGTAPDTVSCLFGNMGSGPYTKGAGTVINTIATGGMTIDTNIYTSITTQHQYFAEECGKNGNIGITQTANCPTGGVYGFTLFTVNNDGITATFNQINSQFTDTYSINVNNPPGDFSLYSGSTLVSRGVVGGPGPYTSLGTINFNSFGGFSNTITLTLGSVTGGPTNTCPGSTCPTASLNPTSLTLSGDGAASSTLTVSTTFAPPTATTPCGNPQASSAYVYSVTITATSGSTHHQMTMPLYIYGHADVNKDGVVNIVDLVLVAQRFGQNTGDPNYNPNIDMTNDGHIDIADLSTVGSTFSIVC